MRAASDQCGTPQLGDQLVTLDIGFIAFTFARAGPHEHPIR